MCKKAPGKSSRQGITLVQLMEMFPDEDSAHAWFGSPGGGALPGVFARVATVLKLRGPPARCPIGAHHAGIAFQYEREPSLSAPKYRCGSGSLRFICAQPASRACPV